MALGKKISYQSRVKDEPAYYCNECDVSLKTENPSFIMSLYIYIDLLYIDATLSMHRKQPISIQISIQFKGIYWHEKKNVYIAKAKYTIQQYNNT